MALITRMYQNTTNNPKTQGKFYGRIVHIETLGLEDMAEHISKHGSPFTVDTIMGVLKAFRNCLVEQVLESKKVKIDGLGTFYVSAQSEGSDSADEFSADNIKRLHLRFLPEQAMRNNLSSAQLRQQTRLSDIAGILGTASAASSAGGGSDDDKPTAEQPED